ncbi:MAG: hypothetical protein AAGK32_03555 [Actinomycetota bacterium]
MMVGAATVGGWLTGSATVVALVPMGLAWAGHVRHRRRRSRQRSARRSAAIAAVDALIQRLKAGGTLRQATGPDGVGLDAVVDDELVATTLQVLTRRGGRALPSLERLSDTLRSAHAMEREARAQAGQATASAALMVILPLAFAVALALIDDRLRTFYLWHPLGTACLAVAVALSHLGWWLMERTIEAVA